MGLSDKVGYRTIACRLIGATGAAAIAIGVAGCGSSGLSADAGADSTVSIGEAPVFDGCESSGDSLMYSWTIVEAPADMAEDVGKVLRESIADCSFTLESDMEIADTGTWVVELSVTNGSDTATDQVTVTVS